MEEKNADNYFPYDQTQDMEPVGVKHYWPLGV